jgi:photosystem II stability/assembly factor-like uncharacterized protein
MTFANSNVGYVNGLKTIDGGLTWTPQSGSENFMHLHALSENHILASMDIGGGNTLFESTDGGLTWTNTVSTALQNLDQVHGYATREFSFIDDQTGYVALQNLSFAYADTLWIMKTLDSGNTWSFVSVSSPTPTPGGGFGLYGLRALDFATLDTGLVIHDFGLLRTTDGGNSWSEVRPLSAPSNFGFTTIYANTGNHLIVGGFVPFTTNVVEILYESFDGGMTWSSGVSLSDLGFQDVTCTSQRCFAVGNKGKVYSNVLDSTSVSIPELTINKLTIFPSPSSTFIEYRFENGGGALNFMEITNLSGQRMKEYSSEGNRVNVTELPYGVYFIKLMANGKPYVKRFVKN